MELRHLRYFVAVAEELSFTRAAERLHIAQPPLSTQIRQLEGEVGTPLFVRDRRRVFLTQAGRVLLDDARAVLAGAEAAKASARDAATGAGGRVSLGYTASAIFTERLPAVIRRFRRRHPAVELSLHEMTSLEQLDALHAQRLDIAILRKLAVALPRGVAVEPWYSAPLVAAVPAGHALAKRRALRTAELADEPLLTYPRDAGIGLYWSVLELFSRAGVRPRIARSAREPAVMIGLVSAGAGIAIVPADTRCIRLPGVAYVRLADVDAVSTLWLASLAGGRRDAERPVAQLLASLRTASSPARKRAARST